MAQWKRYTNMIFNNTNKHASIFYINTFCFIYLLWLFILLIYLIYKIVFSVFGMYVRALYTLQRCEYHFWLFVCVMENMNHAEISQNLPWYPSTHQQTYDHLAGKILMHWTGNKQYYTSPFALKQTNIFVCIVKFKFTSQKGKDPFRVYHGLTEIARTGWKMSVKYFNIILKVQHLNLKNALHPIGVLRGVTSQRMQLNKIKGIYLNAV